MEQPPKKSGKFAFKVQDLKNKLKKQRPKINFTFKEVVRSLSYNAFRSLRIRSGVMGSGFLCLAFAGYTGVYGPDLENPYHRYALAGTTATVVVEFAIHGLDTLNMRSKALEGGNKKFLQ